jgi:hypothetical protein
MVTEKSKRHELTPSVVSLACVFVQCNQLKMNPIIKKSDLLDAEFREQDDDEFYTDKYEPPVYNDSPPDETHKIKHVSKNPAMRERTKALTSEFNDIFSTTLPTEPARLEPFVLQVDDKKWEVRANQGPPRQHTVEKQQFLLKQLIEYKKQNVIQNSNAAYYSQIHMVRKPLPNDWRTTVDFRNLNNAAQQNKGVIPNIKEMLARIGSKQPKIFSKFDLTKGYHQNRLAEGSKQYTAFTSTMGVFEWNRLPMGLMNAGGHFQREVGHNAFRGLIYTILELYIDDILAPSSGATQEEYENNHIDSLRRIFERCRKFNLKLNPEKSIIGDSQLDFCGHLLSEAGISFSAEKLGLVEDFPLPKSYEDLKRWLGLVTYFRDHVKIHSLITAPLDKISGNKEYQSRKKSNVPWTDELTESYTDLKQKILACPTLFYIKEGPQYTLILECDASSKKGLGGYLKQIERNEKGEIINEFPIAFVSKAWSKTELPWGIPDKEAYAIIYSVRKLEYLLADRYFIIKTDHKNITFINFDDNARVKRWKIILQAFNFDVEFIEGKKNIVADALSRVYEEQEYQSPFQPTFRLGDDLSSDYVDINTAYRISDKPQPIRVNHNSVESIVWSNSLRVSANPARRQENIDDDTDSDDDDFGIPNRQRIPQDHFNDLLSTHNHNVGHGSVDLTYERVHRIAPNRWPWKQRRFVVSFCKRCPFCQKMREIKMKILSSPFVLSTYRMFQRIAFDTIGPLPESADGYKHILVLIDTFSRWVHLFALRRLLAREAAEKIIQYIGIYGSPEQFLSDQGTQFKNQTFDEVNKLLGIDHQFSTAYSSEENGIVERVNKEVMNKIRAFVFHKKFCYDWNLNDLPLTQRMLNSRVHSRTGCSPASLVMPAVNLDRNIIIKINNQPHPLDGQPVVNPVDNFENFDFRSLSQQIQDRYEDLALAAKESLLIQDNEHINNYTADRTEFKAGSYVLVSFKSKDGAVKFNTLHRGPLQVQRQVGRNTFRLKNLVNGVSEEYNRQDLIPYDIDIERYNPKSIAESDKLLLEIERVISHTPRNPKSASQLSFVIQWTGYESEDDRTTETWKDNKTLRKNRIILRYLEEKGLSKFIPKNINYESSDSD